MIVKSSRMFPLLLQEREIEREMSPRQCLEGVWCCVVPELCLSAVSFNQRLPGQPIVTTDTWHVPRHPGSGATLYTRHGSTSQHIMHAKGRKLFNTSTCTTNGSHFSRIGRWILAYKLGTLVSQYVRAMKEPWSDIWEHCIWYKLKWSSLGWAGLGWQYEPLEF